MPGCIDAVLASGRADRAGMEVHGSRLSTRQWQGTTEALGHLVASQAQTHDFFCIGLSLILVGQDALELKMLRCRPDYE